jgi:4-amino-4-deoxy-L-arabinose transferase-like glycosyltransferase
VRLAGWRPTSIRSDLVSGERPEFNLGALFMTSEGVRSFWLVTLARWACIPFSLLGGYVCWRWARELYGPAAGLMAMTLWCFCPNIIANAQMITADAAAAAMGVAAGYVFWRWLKQPGWRRAIGAGLLLGLAELTKTTWIILFGLWPALWLAWRLPFAGQLPRRARLREGCQLVAVLLIGLYVINVGYGFYGSFRKLGDYGFISEVLGGPSAPGKTETPRNRFSGTWLGKLPVPFPKDYVLGLDRQRIDFEKKLWSYLHGEWRLGGWWYYYLYGMAIKVPLGTWVLTGLAAWVSVARRGRKASWLNDLALLMPPAAVIILVSSQTGFNHHVRYVLPALPFVFVWSSQVVGAAQFGRRGIVAVAAAALAWSVASSLWVCPHNHNYFNELAGGPAGGHNHLANSNADWGQDLLYLNQWMDEHPEARPLALAYDNALVQPEIVGIPRLTPPEGPGRESAPAGNSSKVMGPLPGWYAMSVNLIHKREGTYEYFLQFQPAAIIGYTHYVYPITPDEANRVRRDLGLSELPAPDRQAGKPQAK